MIRVSDPEHMVPEIFQSHRDLVRSDDRADIEILPVPMQYVVRNAQNNHLPTIFVDTEPAMHQAHEHYGPQLQARPNHALAVTAWSRSVPWQIRRTVRWLSNAAYVVRRNPDIPMVTPGPKPWLATALWGGWMRQRGIMLGRLRDHRLTDRCLITHLRRRIQDFDASDPEIFWEYQSPAIRDLDEPRFNDLAYTGGLDTMLMLGDRHGDGWLSHVIPYRIYDSARVSIVSETLNLAVPDTFYVSEKIVKPMLVGHAFWVCGCQYYLKYLRELGFQTFGDFWDESYDDIEDADSRSRAIIDSFAGFAALTPRQQDRALNDLHPRLMHNRARLLDLGWMTQDLADCIRSMVV